MHRRSPSISDGGFSSSSLPGGGCGKSQPEPSATVALQLQQLSTFIVNIFSFRAHAAELVAHLAITLPTNFMLTETWLDKSCEEFPLAGYCCVSRRDRDDGRNGGGVSVYVKVSFESLCFLGNSATAERSWHVLHSDIGPVVLGAW